MKTSAKVQKPTALCRSQLSRFQFDLHPIVRLRRHFLIPGHQMTGAGQTEQGDQHRARAVDQAAAMPAEQIVVKIQEPRNETISSPQRVAQILPGVGVEQPDRGSLAALQCDFSCLVRVSRFKDIYHLVTGVDVLPPLSSGLLRSSADLMRRRSYPA